MVHKNHSVNENCDLTNFVFHHYSHSIPVLSSCDTQVVALHVIMHSCLFTFTMLSLSVSNILPSLLFFVISYSSFKILYRPLLQVLNQAPTSVSLEPFLCDFRALCIHRNHCSYMTLGICLFVCLIH